MSLECAGTSTTCWIIIFSVFFFLVVLSKFQWPYLQIIYSILLRRANFSTFFFSLVFYCDSLRDNWYGTRLGLHRINQFVHHIINSYWNYYKDVLNLKIFVFFSLYLLPLLFFRVNSNRSWIRITTESIESIPLRFLEDVSQLYYSSCSKPCPGMARPLQIGTEVCLPPVASGVPVEPLSERNSSRPLSAMATPFNPFSAAALAAAGPVLFNPNSTAVDPPRSALGAVVPRRPDKSNNPIYVKNTFLEAGKAIH